jgi:hypothetical protein
MMIIRDDGCQIMIMIFYVSFYHKVDPMFILGNVRWSTREFVNCHKMMYEILVDDNETRTIWFVFLLSMMTNYDNHHHLH